MRRGKFRLSHSTLVLIVLLLVQGALIHFFPVGALAWLTLCFAAVGALAIIYVSTEIIEDVRNPSHMLLLLSAVVAEFVILFAFEYWFLLLVSPGSFPTLSADPISLLLDSSMVFVFNPLFLPATILGRVLLLINTATAIGLVLFILQNIWQIRRPTVL